MIVCMEDKCVMGIELERALRDYFTLAAKSQTAVAFKPNLRTWVLTSLMDKADKDLGLTFEKFKKELDNDNLQGKNK